MEKIDSAADDVAALPAKGAAPIQSLERAVSILEVVGRHAEGARLSDISREVGLHVSTVFNLVKSLEILGCLRMEEGGKRYRMGRTILSLASSCQTELDLIDVARPLLRSLSGATGEASHIAAWYGDEVLILARQAGPGAFQLSEQIGSKRPAYATAIGKALLSGFSEAQFSAWAQRVPLTPLTDKTITDAETLLRQIARVRAEHIAYDDCEYNPEARCLASPVRDFTGAVVGSIGVSGPIWRVSLHDVGQMADIVRSTAEQLSRELGYSAAA